MDYSDVFNYRDDDMGLTMVVCHKILLAAGIAPIRQAIRQLCPEKELSR